MSRDYSVIVCLDANFNRGNVLTILKNGARSGFIYYDHRYDNEFREFPIFTPEEAVNKIFKAIDENLNTGPAVYTQIKDDYYALLYFFKKGDFLELHIGSLNNIKDLESGHIDFEFYIEAALMAVKGLNIDRLLADRDPS
jgi:hypothetical protein